MIILERTFRLTREQHKTHARDSFEVEPGTKKLFVDFRFSPAVVDDRSLLARKFEEEASVFPPMKRKMFESYFLEAGRTLMNMVTLTLSGPGGFVGCAHNQGDRPVIVISEEQSSPGFFRGAPAAGTWVVTVSAFSVYSDAEAVLRIEGAAS